MTDLHAIPPSIIGSATDKVAFIDPERDPSTWADRYGKLGWHMVVLYGVEADPDGNRICTCAKGADCRSPGKHPIARAWQDSATSDAEEIKKQIAGRNVNIGIATGHGAVVLDVDGAMGQESLSQLLDEHPDTVLGPVARTGSGGLHLYFRTDEEFTNKVKLLPGLDVRSFGGQVVACPSRHKSGASYVWENNSWNLPMPPLPEWLGDLFRGVSDHSFNPRTWLAKQPPAIEGEGGSKVLMTMMARVLHNSEVRTAQQMLEVFEAWNQTCVPPWSDRELIHAFENAYRRFAAGNPVKLPLDKNGQVVCHRTHMHEILSKDPNFEFAFSKNARTGDILFNNHTLSDPEICRIELDICARYCLRQVNKMWLIDSINERADANNFDPVGTYLKRLTWDGRPRLGQVPAKILGCDESALSASIFKKWAIGAVRRALQPGCQMDTVLILNGPQGYHKSTFFRVLAGDENFADTSIDLANKDAYQALTAWILEWGELSAMKKTDAERVKGFITSRVDKYRRPYDRFPIEQKRCGVIVGSTNDQFFLNDPTGSRRFWVLQCKRDIRIDYAVRDRDQIWAEALELAKAGEPHWLDSSEDDARAEMNTQFSEEDILYHQALEYIDAAGAFVHLPALLTALNLPEGTSGRTRGSITRALRERQMVGDYLMVDGHKKRVWRKAKVAEVG